jgi:hypothetical protein
VRARWEFFGGIGGVSFVSQLAGSTLAFVFDLMSSFLVYAALNKTVGIRLDQEDEFMGADLSIHKMLTSWKMLYFATQQARTTFASSPSFNAIKSSLFSLIGITSFPVNIFNRQYCLFDAM